MQLHSRTDIKRLAEKKDSTLSRRADLNLGVLLLEFFELYGLSFNYDWVGISVRKSGRYLPKDNEGTTSLFIEDPQCPGR